MMGRLLRIGKWVYLKMEIYQNGNFSLRICDQPAVSDNPHVVHHVIYSHRYGYMVICDADFFGWYSKYDTLRVFNIASENDPPIDDS